MNANQVFCDTPEKLKALMEKNASVTDELSEDELAEARRLIFALPLNEEKLCWWCVSAPRNPVVAGMGACKEHLRYALDSRK